MDFVSRAWRAIAPVGRGRTFGFGRFCWGSAGSFGADCWAKAEEQANEIHRLSLMTLLKIVVGAEIPWLIECAPENSVLRSGAF